MDKSVLIGTACQDLLTYGMWDTKAKVKYWVKKYLLKRSTVPEDPVFWPTGLLAAGLWQCREEIRVDGNAGMDMASIDLALEAYFDRWFRKGCPVLWLDDLLAGETLLAVCETNQRDGEDNAIIFTRHAEEYRQMLEKIAAFGFGYPKDETDSFLYRAGRGNEDVLVDSIGLACPFLYHYGVVYDRKEFMELAVKQIVNFLAYGMDAFTGLPYHGYSIAEECKYGIIGWGRAAGWLLRGMCGCMITQYGRERIEEAYVKLANTVLPYQRKDGYFSWQLQAMEGPADTSATGMICAALKKGIEMGILSGKGYEQSLRDGMNAVEKAIRNGRVYQCSGECVGPGQYPQHYGAYPWAHGTALML